MFWRFESFIGPESAKLAKVFWDNISFIVVELDMNKQNGLELINKTVCKEIQTVMNHRGIHEKVLVFLLGRKYLSVSSGLDEDQVEVFCGKKGWLFDFILGTEDIDNSLKKFAQRAYNIGVEPIRISSNRENELKQSKDVDLPPLGMDRNSYRHSDDAGRRSVFGDNDIDVNLRRYSHHNNDQLYNIRHSNAQDND